MVVVSLYKCCPVCYHYRNYNCRNKSRCHFNFILRIPAFEKTVFILKKALIPHISNWSIRLPARPCMAGADSCVGLRLKYKAASKGWYGQCWLLRWVRLTCKAASKAWYGWCWLPQWGLRLTCKAARGVMVGADSCSGGWDWPVRLPAGLWLVLTPAVGLRLTCKAARGVMVGADSCSGAETDL